MDPGTARTKADAPHQGLPHVWWKNGSSMGRKLLFDARFFWNMVTLWWKECNLDSAKLLVDGGKQCGRWSISIAGWEDVEG